jgi:hypothetical protein
MRALCCGSQEPIRVSHLKIVILLLQTESQFTTSLQIITNTFMSKHVQTTKPLEHTERVITAVTFARCSFESLTEDFRDFFSPSRQMAGQYLDKVASSVNPR